MLLTLEDAIYVWIETFVMNYNEAIVSHDLSDFFLLFYMQYYLLSFISFLAQNIITLSKMTDFNLKLIFNYTIYTLQQVEGVVDVELMKFFLWILVSIPLSWLCTIELTPRDLTLYYRIDSLRPCATL